MRISKKMVDRQIQFLAELLGRPTMQLRKLSMAEQAAIQGRRNFEWNIGALYLDGYNLAAVANQGGGIYIILYGHSLQDIFGKIVAYREGFELGQQVGNYSQLCRCKRYKHRGLAIR